MKQNRHRAHKWSSVEMEGDGSHYGSTITKSQKEHRHTHTLSLSLSLSLSPQDLLPDQTIPGTSERLGWASSSWAAQITPRSRLRNKTFILRLPWSVFCRGWGYSSSWRGWKLVPLFIGLICWRDVSWTNGCSSWDQGYTEVIFSILLGRSHLLCNFIIVIMTIVLGEAWGNLDIWPLEWIRTHKHIWYFKVRNICFPL